MNLLKLLLQSSRWSVAVAIAAGVLGGLTTAGLIALVQIALVQPESIGAPLIAAFAGLCASVRESTARASSQAVR